MRDYLRDQARQLASGPTRFDQPDEAELSEVDQLLGRIWPQLTAMPYLRDLLNSRDRLLEAAGSDFLAQDITHLHRPRADRLAEEVWAESDTPLLDYVEHRLNGHHLYAHVIVDEAQDLSPMQLLMIANRSRQGAYTVLGDIAQSTGTWSRDDWEDVTQILEKGCPVVIEELLFGYRVPKQVYEFAAQLLPTIAPGLDPPIAVRDGPSDPVITRVDGDTLGDATVGAVQSYAANGLFVGVICPRGLKEEVAQSFEQRSIAYLSLDGTEMVPGAPINLLDPINAKGLEFDAVVVVEPQEIINNYQRGERLLYVALTRTTKHLTVIHHQELPVSLRADQSEGGKEQPRHVPSVDPDSGQGLDPDGSDSELQTTDPVPPLPSPIDAWAERLAATIRNDLAANQHRPLLEKVAELLDLGIPKAETPALVSKKPVISMAERGENLEPLLSPRLDDKLSREDGGVGDRWQPNCGYWVCHPGKQWREVGVPFATLESALFGPSGAREIIEGATRLEPQIKRWGPAQAVVVRVGDLAILTDGENLAVVNWDRVPQGDPKAIIALLQTADTRRPFSSDSFVS